MKHPERLSVWTARHGCLTLVALSALVVTLVVTLVVMFACMTTPTPTPTPMVTQELPTFSLYELQTAIANLETAVPQLYATAQVLSTIQAPVETLAARVDQDIAIVDEAIATVQALATRLAQVTPPHSAPTPTFTPTPSPLCQPCKPNDPRPPDHWCKDCGGSLGWRWVSYLTPNADCLKCANKSPILKGIATHYDPEDHAGNATKSGEPYDPNAMTCAVPHELWEQLQGRWLLVTTGEREIVVRVNDCGKLTEAGKFKWGNQRIGKYDVRWFFPAPEGYHIVLDLTPLAYDLLWADGKIVMVYVLGE